MERKRPRWEEASTSQAPVAPPQVATLPPQPLGVLTPIFVDRGFAVEHTVDLDTLMFEGMAEWGLTYLTKARY